MDPNNSFESNSASVILSLTGLIFSCSIYLLGQHKDSPVYNQLTINRINNPEFDPIHNLDDTVFQTAIESQKYPKFVPDLYVITPTYTRQTQLPDIVSIIQAMMVSDRNIVLLIVEDTTHDQLNQIDFNDPSPNIQLLINRFNYPKSNIKIIDMKQATTSNYLLRGMDQRNLALKWIKKHHLNSTAGVYFGDDDNTFSFKLFQEMTRIQFYNENATVGFLPIGFIRTDQWDQNKKLKKNTWNKGMMMQCNGTRIVRFRTGFAPERKFATDMAGFGFTVKQLLDSNARFSERTHKGHLETDFIQNLLGVEHDNPYKRLKKHMHFTLVSGFGHVPKEKRAKTVALANSCTEKLVWHTKRLMSLYVNGTDTFGQQVREIDTLEITERNEVRQRNEKTMKNREKSKKSQ